jgi:hypothetical protein
MSQLGTGLSKGTHYEDALSVREAELSMNRRLGVSESNILAMQGNLATAYSKLGQLEQCLRIERDVYRGYLKLNGEKNERTLQAANNYADSLRELRRFEEAKPVLCKNIPVARRVLGDNDINTLRMRWSYAETLYKAIGATLDDFREAVMALEDTERIARRVFGGAHPFTGGIEIELRDARAALRARETPTPSNT